MYSDVELHLRFGITQRLIIVYISDTIEVVKEKMRYPKRVTHLHLGNVKYQGNQA